MLKLSHAPRTYPLTNVDRREKVQSSATPTHKHQKQKRRKQMKSLSKQPNSLPWFLLLLLFLLDAPPPPPLSERHCFFFWFKHWCCFLFWASLSGSRCRSSSSSSFGPLFSMIVNHYKLRCMSNFMDSSPSFSLDTRHVQLHGCSSNTYSMLYPICRHGYVRARRPFLGII